jgi:hypothetical protein
MPRDVLASPRVVSDDADAIVVPSADSARLSVAVQGASGDDQLRARLRRAAHGHLEEHFTCHPAFDRIPAIYDELLEGRVGAR